MQPMFPEERFERMERGMEFLLNQQGEFHTSLQELRNFIELQERQIARSFEITDRLSEQIELLSFSLVQEGEKCERRQEEFDLKLERSTEAFTRRQEEFNLKLERSTEEFNRRQEEFNLKLERSTEEFNRRQEEFDRRLDRLSALIERGMSHNGDS